MVSRIWLKGPDTRRAAAAALGYLSASVLWVLITDVIVDSWHPQVPSYLQTVKGLLFVVATALYWFLVLRRLSHPALRFLQGPAPAVGSPDPRFCDPLTELPTRKWLTDYLTSLLAAGRKGTLIFLDMDGMQLINETHGHEAGDQVLRAVARALKRTAPRGTLAARLDGDDFGLFIPDLVAAESCLAVEEVRREVAAEAAPHAAHPISFCAGVVPIEPGMTAGVGLLVGELVLRRARETGRGGICTVATTEAMEGLRATVQWGQRLEEALRSGALTLHYQPIAELKTGRAVHAEALLRLVDQTGREQPAACFLEAAEQFRLMPQIDRWVLEQVLTELEEHPELHLFMNLSGQSLRDPVQLHLMAARVQQAGSAASRLTFEITETVAGGDPERLRQWMEQMTRLGCRFALDDLGHGFSSLASFTSLPLDYVKIDGSFVVGIETNPKNRLVVEAVAHIARQMGIRVVAEWVEDAAALRVLREIGVDLGQGFFLGHPAPLAEAMTRLAAPVARRQ